MPIVVDHRALFAVESPETAEASTTENHVAETYTLERSKLSSKQVTTRQSQRVVMLEVSALIEFSSLFLGDVHFLIVFPKEVFYYLTQNQINSQIRRDDCFLHHIMYISVIYF